MASKIFARISIFIFSCALISECHGARVLFILPLSTKSMANIFEPLAVALTDRGHHVTTVTPTKFQAHPNLTQVMPFDVEEFCKDYPDQFEIRRHSTLWTMPVDWQEKYCNVVYDHPAFKKLINQQFDLVVANILFQDCFAGVFHKFGSPIILVGSLPIPSSILEHYGTYLPSSFIPVFPLGDISEQLNFRQRVKNFLYNAYISVMVDVWTRPPLEEVYRKRLGDPSLPSILDIYRKQVSLIFINSHYGLTLPRPYLPNVVEVGGIHCRPAKPLPKELKEWADGAKEGFILFSLGSMVKTSQMPEDVRAEFAKAFSKLKEKVIWKWEKEEGMKDISENVKLVKWLPQQDLLGHPNIKLFITHGGLLSTEEAVYHGVPVLGMPVFIDQDSNMKLAEFLGFGVKGEILDLKETELTPLIRKVLDNPGYLQKAKQVSEIFRDQPQTPLERALYYTEYVLRHKGAYHLQSTASNLNLIQYFCVDVIIFLAVIVLMLILTMYCGLKLIVRLLCGIGKYKVKNEKSKIKKR